MIPFPLPNPSREPVDRNRICELAGRLQVSPELLDRVISAQAVIPFEMWIFSAARSRAHQERISATPFDDSTHADTDRQGCPRLATGIDVQPRSTAMRLSHAAVAQMGAAFVMHGLRWGGGAPVDDMGIPVGNERWHVDLGPRMD